MVSLDRGEEKEGLLTDENPHLVRPSYRLLALVRGKGCKWRVSKLALELVAFPKIHIWVKSVHLELHIAT
jgi:hypothetical protein